jgi:regulator of protease activity HflC (stomatin/prohibitin superfamily)
MDPEWNPQIVSRVWDIRHYTVEVKDVELTEELKRAMAKQAEAERERRAKVIHAAGEAGSGCQYAGH